MKKQQNHGDNITKNVDVEYIQQNINGFTEHKKIQIKIPFELKNTKISKLYFPLIDLLEKEELEKYGAGPSDDEFCESRFPEVEIIKISEVLAR